jgi:hypothetical protein
LARQIHPTAALRALQVLHELANEVNPEYFDGKSDTIGKNEGLHTLATTIMKDESLLNIDEQSYEYHLDINYMT